MRKYMDKFLESKHLEALSQGMMRQLGLIVIGSFFLIIANPPINPEVVDFETANFFVKFLLNWKEWATANYQILTMPYNFTMGSLSLLTAINVAYSLAKMYKQNAMLIATMSASIFLMTSVIPLEEGYNLQYISADGMFYAIIVAYIVVDLAKLLDHPRLKIKLDKSVPTAVSDFMNSLLPFAIIVTCFFIPYAIIMSKTGNVLPQQFYQVFAPSIDAVSGLWGFLIILTISNVLWLFGINGFSVVFPILFTTTLTGTLQNAELMANGSDLTNPMNIQMLRVALIGGSGNTIGLAIHMMFSKSKKLNAVGKVGIIPSVFGINEPIIFGTPIVLNPYLIAPFVITPIISVLLCYFGQISGILTMSYLVDPPFIPFFAQSYLNSLSIINVLFGFVIVGISYLMYLPFFKKYEAQEVLREQANLEEINN